MAVDRHVTISGTVALGSHVSQTDEEIHALWNSSCLLVTVGGTGNAITGTVTPTLDAYADGMGFVFVAGASNSGAVTINIDSRGARDVRDADNGVLASGAIVSGRMYEIRYDGTRFRIVSSGITAADVAAMAPLASPVFTDNPRAPTPSPGDDDTSIATTAFVVNHVGDLTDINDAVATRDDDGVIVADENDIVAGEIEPSGRLAMPAILAENVSGVPAGWLRREHLSTVAHLPLAVGNFVYGQSNALGNRADPVLSTLRSGRNMRMFNAGIRAFSGGGTPAENREDLVPHVEAYAAEDGPTPERGETSCFGSAEAFCDLVETEQGWPDYASTVMVISAASGEGSSTIAQLMAEEPFDRFMLDVEAASDLAKSEFGSDVVLAVPAVFWNQIEANVDDETDPEDWIDEMVAAQAAIEAGVNTARGVATSDSTRVPLIIPQTSTWDHYGKTPALALAAVTLAQMSDKFILLPSYMLEFSDGVHYTAAGHHGIVGPRVGFIQKRIAINGQARSTFAPTVPTDNDREGKFARFTFSTWAGDDLTVDTRLVLKVENFGLEAFEDDDETPATIDRVWVHPREVIVKFASNPSAGMHLKNALAGTGSGWDEGPRSNLRTTHGDHVAVRTMQGVMPVHEWVPAFNYQLS